MHCRDERFSVLQVSQIFAAISARIDEAKRHEPKIFFVVFNFSLFCEPNKRSMVTTVAMIGGDQIMKKN